MTIGSRNPTLRHLRSKVVGAALLLAALAAGLGPCAAAAERSTSHQPSPRRSSTTYRTSNFTVQAPTRRIAEQVARAAEQSRKALARLWLGRELPAWAKPCPVRVEINLRGVGGATTFSFHEGKVVQQSMSVQGPLETVLADVLPHEVMHTILAHRFGRPVFRWADEGVACLAESATGRERQEQALRHVLDRGQLLPLARLLGLRDYPMKDLRTFYAQGHSLTRFLVGARGQAKFLAFLAQGERDGWNRAVKAQYGYRNVAALERAWLAEVRTARPARLPRRKLTLPPRRAGAGPEGPPRKQVRGFRGGSLESAP
jgi:hypothetical protein